MNSSQAANAVALKRYYKFHSRIYDATRWSFLFGRNKIIQHISEQLQPKSILEVGCGTGKNLQSLAKTFPEAKIRGLDLSEDMLNIANNKLESLSDRVLLTQKKYDAPLKNSRGDVEKYDIILFSYALSMFNPGWQAAIKAAKEQLGSNGMIAIVDFHHSRFRSFRNWMEHNHVKMEGHLLPLFETEFEPVISKQTNAYGGVWQYLYFIGKKK